jgi:hypothetical protein
VSKNNFSIGGKRYESIHSEKGSGCACGFGGVLSSALVDEVKMLDVFCGVGGWTKQFQSMGWECTGVDLEDFSRVYPGAFVQADALTLSRSFIDSFDAVVMSPLCEEFARAWLPWLRADKQPAEWAINLLCWSVALCDRPRRIVECSNFAARHVPGAVRCESYALWGDVPLLMPFLPRSKTRKSGKNPELRAEIPEDLAITVARWFRP